MYRKPEVTKLASTLEAIQSGTNKVQNSLMDSPYLQVTTPGAYEADE